MDKIADSAGFSLLLSVEPNGDILMEVYNSFATPVFSPDDSPDEQAIDEGFPETDDFVEEVAATLSCLVSGVFNTDIEESLKEAMPKKLAKRVVAKFRDNYLHELDRERLKESKKDRCSTEVESPHYEGKFPKNPLPSRLGQPVVNPSDVFGDFFDFSREPKERDDDRKFNPDRDTFR